MGHDTRQAILATLNWSYFCMFSIETKTSKPKDITYILHPDIPSSSQDAGGWLCVEIICNSMRPCSRHIPHNPISVFTQIFLFILPAPHPGWCCSHRRFCGDNRLSTMHCSQEWLPWLFHKNWTQLILEWSAAPDLLLPTRQQTQQFVVWTPWLTQKQCLLIGLAQNQAPLSLAEWSFWARSVASNLVICLFWPLSWHGEYDRVARGWCESVCYNNRHAAADTFQP